MRRARLTPPNLPVLPKAASGPMPNGDAQDPPVGQIALDAARDIWRANVTNQSERDRPAAVSRVQIRIEAAINEALDRCQALGGRRVR